MANTANLKPIEPGEISPEDLERFAATFRPMWELDDAPFSTAPANLTASDVRALSAGGGNGEVAAALEATPPQVARAAPKKQAQQPAATAVPQPRARIPSRDASASLEIDMRAMKRSNKAVYLAIGAVVIVAGAFLGIRYMGSSDAEATPAPAATVA